MIYEDSVISAVQRECNRQDRGGRWINYSLSFVLSSYKDVVYEGDPWADSTIIACKVSTRSKINLILSVS